MKLEFQSPRNKEDVSQFIVSHWHGIAWSEQLNMKTRRRGHGCCRLIVRRSGRHTEGQSLCSSPRELRVIHMHHLSLCSSRNKGSGQQISVLGLRSLRSNGGWVGFLTHVSFNLAFRAFYEAFVIWIQTDQKVVPNSLPTNQSTCA